jgi:TIR domain
MIAEAAKWDVFVCHASEDKDDFVRPLARGLETRGLKVWFDEFTLTVGDSLRRSIDRGLAGSRFGVVVISPDFLHKEWPQRELDGLVARETGGVKVILPVWHKTTADLIRRYSPTLADKVAVSSARGLEHVIAELLRAMGQPSSSMPDHARVQSVDGVIERPSAKAAAQRVRREAVRDRLFGDSRWITETVLPTVATLFATIDRIGNDVQKESGISFRSGANERRCVLTNDRVSLFVTWRQPFVNKINDAEITAAEFHCQLPLPGERIIDIDSLPAASNQYRFRPELTIKGDLCWVDKNKARPTELLSTDDLADKCVRIFLDFVSRANREGIFDLNG